MRQIWLYLTGRPYTPLTFTTPGLYRYVRHPLYVGWFVTFWATPAMTLGHLIFARQAGNALLQSLDQCPIP